MAATSVFRPSQTVARYGDVVWWAERGLVRVRNEKTGRLRVYSVVGAAEIQKAVSDMLWESKRSEKNLAYLPRYAELSAFVNDAADVVREAHEQGTPDNPQARRDLAARRPGWFVMSPASL